MRALTVARAAQVGWAVWRTACCGMAEEGKGVRGEHFVKSSRVFLYEFVAATLAHGSPLRSGSWLNFVSSQQCGAYAVPNLISFAILHFVPLE